jgi:guanylate kinase
MSRRCFPIVVSAASGTGKTTLSHLLLEADKELQLSISFTTRAPRGEEREGVDYTFIDEPAFRRMIEREAFIEWAEVHGNLYGSSREWTEQTLAAGKDVLFDIDVQGGQQLKRIFPEAALVFVLPPSLEELEQRLRRRGTDADAVIQKRLTAARQEIARGLESYDFVITNQHLDRALFDLTAIVRAQRLRGLDRARMREKLLGPG